MNNLCLRIFLCILILCVVIYALKLLSNGINGKSICSIVPSKPPPEALQGIKDTFYEDVHDKVNNLLHIVNPKHNSLCKEAPFRSGVLEAWSHCLPISGRKDVPYCAKPTRSDLLRRHTPNTLCYGSVINMLLVDVYNTMEELGQEPAILYGSLLGAMRNKSIIPSTEDADIGYAIPLHGQFHSEKLICALRNKGYHMFNDCKDCMWRICVEPRHPLAYNLYNEEMALSRKAGIPYTDLYAMKEFKNSNWMVADTSFGGVINSTDFKPYVKVKVNDAEMNTLGNAIKFLERQYGVDWRLEKPRG